MNDSNPFCDLPVAYWGMIELSNFFADYGDKHIDEVNRDWLNWCIQVKA